MLAAMPTLLPLLAAFPATLIPGDGCNGGNCPFVITGDTTCWELVESGCSVETGAITYTDGEPGDPTVLVTVTCDACDSDQEQESSEYSYTQNSGWSFCLSASAEAEWEAPIGPEWSVSVGGEVCWDSSSSKQITGKIKCKPRTKVRLTILETRTPSTVSTELTYTKWGEFKKQDPFPAGCDDSYGDTLRDEVECGTDTSSADIVKYGYTLDYDDLECPTPPGNCDKTAKSIFYEVESEQDEMEHLVDELIPCYYDY